MYTGNTHAIHSRNPCVAVYPCVYREHSHPDEIVNPLSGLSLCIQGTRLVGLYQPAYRRFIPVHTGDIVFASSFICLVTVYPCAYREHRSHPIIPPIRYGLSLCIQGTLLTVNTLFFISRFIPVHTGNTPCSYAIAPLSTVYPCAYREHPSLYSQILVGHGLSLCIQGTHQL